MSSAFAETKIFVACLLNLHAHVDDDVALAMMDCCCARSPLLCLFQEQYSLFARVNMAGNVLQR
jgi:hypothetical protein